MAYDAEKTMLALAKRERRMPLTQEETGLVMGVRQGREIPFSKAYIQAVEARAMAKLRRRLERVLVDMEP